MYINVYEYYISFQVVINSTFFAKYDTQHRYRRKLPRYLYGKLSTAIRVNVSSPIDLYLYDFEASFNPIRAPAILQIYDFPCIFTFSNSRIQRLLNLRAACASINSTLSIGENTIHAIITTKLHTLYLTIIVQ